jgi:hypothetical protein
MKQVFERLAVVEAGELAMEGEKDPLALDILGGGILIAGEDIATISVNKRESVSFRADRDKSVLPSKP